MKYLTLSLGLFILAVACKTQKELGVEPTQTNNSSAKYFEGIIKYKFLMDDVRELTDKEIESQLKQMEAFMGRHMTYYIKGAKSKTVIDGPMMKLTTYTDETDSMYTYSPDLGELSKVSTYDNWNYTYDTIVTSKAIKTINGIVCDLISLKSDEYTWDYYYSEKLKVNPDYFKHSKGGFWDKAIEITGSMPMRFEGKVPGSYIYMEVEDILEQSLEDSIFEIPKI